MNLAAIGASNLEALHANHLTVSLIENNIQPSAGSGDNA